MKILKNFINISFAIILSSCTVSEKNWHEAVSRIGGQSIYIKEDGTIIAKIDNRISDQPRLNIFDSKSANIGYGAIQILHKEHPLEYKNMPNEISDVYILDLRDGQKSLREYRDIIIKQKKAFAK